MAGNNFFGTVNAPGSNFGDNGTVNNNFNQKELVSALDELLKINNQNLVEKKEEIIELKKIIAEKRRDPISLEKVKNAKDWIDLYIKTPNLISESVEATGKLEKLLAPIFSNLSTYLQMLPGA